MGFQSVQLRRRKKLSTGTVVAPRYGMSTSTIINNALLDGLTGRGPTPGSISTVFTLNATPGSGLYQWFAYPQEYGAAQFLDTDSQFYGGWDGASDDPDNVWGPVVFNYNGVPYFVYRTDHNDLALCHWTASFDPSV
jgi:hypothetical protein